MENLEDHQSSIEQRIQRRRQLLEQRLAARQEGSSNSNENTVTVGAEKGPVSRDERIQLIRQRLLQLRTESYERITQYLVVFEQEEQERRQRVESLKKMRVEKQEDEDRSSRKMNGEVEMKWRELFEKKIPQEAWHELNVQKQRCEKILASKDALIEDFLQQLKEADDEYVLALQRQSRDIDQLIAAMRRETEGLTAVYQTELDGIEDSLLEERRVLLDANAEEVNQLMQQRETKEKEFSRKRDQKVLQDQHELDQLREWNVEEYASKKIQLQKEIHALAQQLEAMRAMYLLNQEKLLYNLRVLGQRTEENKRAIRAHREKMQRLQDNLSGLLSRYAEADRRYKQQNRELTTTYQRITEQYKDLQLKYQHFEKMDHATYVNVWKMNEEECSKLVRRCLQADKVIFKELLDQPWSPPKLDFWSTVRENPLSTGLFGHASTTTSMHDFTLPDESDSTTPGGAFGKSVDSTVRQLSEGSLELLNRLQRELPFLKEELELHSDDLDGSIHEDSESLGDCEDASARRLRHTNVVRLCRVLKCTTEDEVNRLLSIASDQINPVAASQNGMRALDVGTIESEDALAVLRTYLEDRTRRQQQLSLTQAPEHTMTPLQEKRSLKKRAEREFWSKIVQVIPEKNLRCWSAVEKTLEKHLNNLQQRVILVEETDRLRQQNDELRMLLNKYLTTQINQELYSPPQLEAISDNS